MGCELSCYCETHDAGADDLEGLRVGIDRDERVGESSTNHMGEVSL